MWWNKRKERNMALTEAPTTELPIPFATEAKRISTENLEARIKQAEKAIFKRACEFINERIEEGYLEVTFDAFAVVYHIDDTLDKSSIFIAMSECINHLSTFGYTVIRDGERRLTINWQYPKEITLDDIERSI